MREVCSKVIEGRKRGVELCCCRMRESFCREGGEGFLSKVRDAFLAK